MAAELLTKRELSVVNASFPPFNPSVTTSDVAYPFGWAMTMFLVLIPFVTWFYNWHWRSAENMFSVDGDYRINWKPESEKSIHPYFKPDSWTWFMYAINPILSMFFVIALVISVWVEYSSRSDGYFIRNRDAAGIIVTSWMGAWLVIVCCIILVDLRYKHKIARASSGEVIPGLSKNTADAYVKHLTTLDNKRFLGMKGSTTLYIRRILFIVNTVFWGVLPSALMMVAIMWDRSGAGPHGSFIQDTELFLIGFGGCLWTIAYIYYSYYCLKYIGTYYESTGFDYVPGTIRLLSYDEIKMIQVGFTSDTTGIRMPTRGLFPYQDLPWHFIISRCAYTFALAYAIYNDETQALSLGLCVGYLPIFLSKVAGSTAYYMTYEGLCWFFFFVFSYLLQGSFYSWDVQSSINFNLMTVNQSSEFPGLAPAEEFGTSVYTVCGIMMALVIITTLKSFSTPQLAPQTIRVSPNGIDNSSVDKNTEHEPLLSGSDMGGATRRLNTLWWNKGSYDGSYN